MWGLGCATPSSSTMNASAAGWRVTPPTMLACVPGYSMITAAPVWFCVRVGRPAPIMPGRHASALPHSIGSHRFAGSKWTRGEEALRVTGRFKFGVNACAGTRLMATASAPVPPIMAPRWGAGSPRARSKSVYSLLPGCTAARDGSLPNGECVVKAHVQGQHASSLRCSHS